MSEHTAAQMPVDAQTVMGRRFTNDLLIFDMSSDGRIVACRAPANRDRTGESFFSLLSVDAAEQVRGYLFSYESAPMVVETAAGVAVIVSIWMAEAALGVAILPNLPSRTLIKLLSVQKHTALIWQSGLESRGALRLSAIMRAAQGTVEGLLEELAALGDCSVSMTVPVNHREMELWARAHLERLSMLIGCPAEISCLDFHAAGCPMRGGLFSAFLLLSLCLCRRYAELRSVAVTLDCISHQPAVAVAMHVLSEDAYSSEALTCLRSLAERNRVFFDVSFHEAHLYLRISPISSDWALLGLKEPNVFDRLSSSDTEMNL